MKVTATKDDGSKIDLNIGITLLVAASEKLSELKRSAFEQIVQTVAKHTQPEVAQPTLLAAMRQFLGEQIRPDGEVAEWIRTWDGRVFTVEHATRKTEKLQGDSARDLFDSMTAEEYADVIHAVNCMIDGQERANDRRDILKTEGNIQKIALQQAKVAEDIENEKLRVMSDRLGEIQKIKKTDQ